MTNENANLSTTKRLKAERPQGGFSLDLVIYYWNEMLYYTKLKERPIRSKIAFSKPIEYKVNTI